MGKGKPPTKRPPAEKKALSYAKDRRNNYGNNDKAARKAIPARKAIESRRVRHEINQVVAQIPALDEHAADVAESSARQDISRVGGWKKSPDQPLRDHVDRQQELAVMRTGRKAASRRSNDPAD